VRRFLIVGVFLVAGAASSQAQEASAIRGIVVTQGDRPLPGAEVLVYVSSRGSSTQSARTEPDGHYQFSDLQPSTYDLEIRARDFQSATIKAVQLEAGKLTVVPAMLLDLSPGIVVACSADHPDDRRPDYYRLAVGNADTGAVAGIVTGEGKTTVRKSIVTLYAQGKGRVSSTSTDGEGRFALPGLSVRQEKYWLSIAAEGYFSEELTHLTVRQGLEAVYEPITLEPCAPGRCQPNLKTIRVLPNCE